MQAYAFMGRRGWDLLQACGWKPLLERNPYGAIRAFQAFALVADIRAMWFWAFKAYAFDCARRWSHDDIERVRANCALCSLCCLAVHFFL